MSDWLSDEEQDRLRDGVRKDVQSAMDALARLVTVERSAYVELYQWRLRDALMALLAVREKLG